MYKKDKIRFFIGPMSKNILDSIIEINKKKKYNVGIIPSRRQVEYNGGYVNNWTTEDFCKYVKSKNSSIVLERDHGGPGQGYKMDDGKESFSIDSKYFDIIHIDTWKIYQKYEDGLRETINAINLCNSINPECNYEIGTEESIRYFSSSNLEKLISDLRKSLKKEIFSKIKYAVVQSGVGLNLGDQVNTGNFNPDRLKEMVRICKDNGMLSKEHNGDYLKISEIKKRFELGLDSINIAPEFGQIETKAILDMIKDLPKYYFETFYNICLDSGRWEKWVNKNFNPTKEKKKIIIISGHYVLSDPQFLKLKREISAALSLTITKIDEKIKTKIIQHLISLTAITK